MLHINFFLSSRCSPSHLYFFRLLLSQTHPLNRCARDLFILQRLTTACSCAASLKSELINVSHFFSPLRSIRPLGVIISPAAAAARFLAICFPLKCQMTRKTALRIIVIIWIFSLVIASPWLMYFTLQPIDSRLMTVEICNEVWPDESTGVAYFVLANLGLCYIMPLFVITACYMAIWLKVWKRSIPGSGEASDSKTGKSLNLQMELVMQRSKLKVAKMMIVVVVIFVISWLPLYCIFARVKLGGPFEVGSVEEKMYMTLAPIAQWLGASNSSINPLLYAFFNKKYRSGFAAIIKSKKCCGPIRYEHAASTYLRQGTINSRSTRRMTRSTRVDIADASPPPSSVQPANDTHPASSPAPALPPPQQQQQLQQQGDKVSGEKDKPETTSEPLTVSHCSFTN